ncbi:hypothetical protein DRE_07734 [Drechslerella stenobrocha 248]|uniref:GH16 domain-containing protein n=1 Tax=Drechslerella stenobrocha 248 TaxID=1043628 RepID=W7IH08_9PEZI|nr:hypothetical protein DRE_07734 [Drechslerella stenobrocha 248]
MARSPTLRNTLSWLPFLAAFASASSLHNRHHHLVREAEKDRRHEHQQYARNQMQDRDVDVDQVNDTSSHIFKRAVPDYTNFGFTLAWADDFTGSSGSLPSSSNWIFDLGTKYPGGPDNWGTGEIQTYTQSTDNVYVDGAGNLNIVPIRSGNSWTSARLETKASFGCGPGERVIFEARIKLPSTAPAKQQGIWPAFWAMGRAFRDAGNDGWPGTGEIDVMEAYNGDNTILNAVHCGTYPGGVCNEPNGISRVSSFTRGSFRTFKLIIDRSVSASQDNWRTESLIWQTDGVEKFRLNGGTIGDRTAWSKLTHERIFLLLNVAIGGALPNAMAGQGIYTPNANTIGGLESAMVIDYVAVYSSKAATTTTTTTTTRAATTTTRATTTATQPPSNSGTPSPIQPGQFGQCTGWKYVQDSDTCASIVSRYSSIGLTLDKLIDWNPALGTTSNCRPTSKFYVCVDIIPKPIQAGQITNCAGWGYTRASDTCASFVNRYSSIGLTVNYLLQWNPALGNSASNCRITPGFYVCAQLYAPKPIQAGQINGCKGWRYAQTSDTCANLVTRYQGLGLTLANLVRWNPALGTTSRCSVTPKFYVCVQW